MAGKGIGNRSSPSVHEGNSEVCQVARQRDHPAISPIPVRLCGSETHRTKVPYTAVGSAGKIILDYVIRQFQLIFTLIPTK